MPGLYVVVPRAAGTLITELIYNFDHQQHVDGRSAEFMAGYGVSASQMQLTEDPYPVTTGFPGGTESIPPSLAGEITRIRFVLAQIISELSGGASANWYDAIVAPGLPFIGARVTKKTGNVSIPNNTTTVLNFSGGTVDFNSTDPAPVWDNMTNPTRFTAPVAGRYFAFGACTWSAGNPSVRLVLSIAMTPASQPGAVISNLSPDGSTQPQAITGLFDMQANDYVEFSVLQNSGGSLLLTTAAFSGLNGSFPTMTGGLVFLGS